MSYTRRSPLHLYYLLNAILVLHVRLATGCKVDSEIDPRTVLNAIKSLEHHGINELSSQGEIGIVYATEINFNGTKWLTFKHKDLEIPSGIGWILTGDKNYSKTIWTGSNDRKSYRQLRYEKHTTGQPVQDSVTMLKIRMEDSFGNLFISYEDRCIARHLVILKVENQNRRRDIETMVGNLLQRLTPNEKIAPMSIEPTEETKGTEIPHNANYLIRKKRRREFLFQPDRTCFVEFFVVNTTDLEGDLRITFPAKLNFGYCSGNCIAASTDSSIQNRKLSQSEIVLLLNDGILSFPAASRQCKPVGWSHSYLIVNRGDGAYVVKRIPVSPNRCECQ